MLASTPHPGRKSRSKCAPIKAKSPSQVRDFGPGLPPGDLGRVFDKFYRADSTDAQTAYGYGLGLYVCRRLVEAQSGRIWAENHPAGGAVFSFTLPVWQG
jgi:two-component system sensor histidine kinase KdpD